MLTSSTISPPVVIGGVGGSGTRLIASILRELGFYMGSDLNSANDNLWSTLLFKRQSLWPIDQHQSDIEQAYSIFINAMHGQRPKQAQEIQFIKRLALADRPQHPSEWLQQRVASLLGVDNNLITNPRWGWKEPNTHIVLPALLKTTPKMKYIHVMRHGLDMAYSSNQNQLQFWGEALLEESDQTITASRSFQYWCAAHRRIIGISHTMGEKFLLLNYDQFCQQPDTELPKLLNFLEIETNTSTQSKLHHLVDVPKSIGRHRQHQPNFISKADLDFLTSLGY